MIGRPPISRSGFGSRSVRGRRRVPSPAPKMKAVLNRRRLSRDTSLFSVSFSIFSLYKFTFISSKSHRGTRKRDVSLLLFSKFGINFHQRYHDETWNGCGHDPEKKVLI